MVALLTAINIRIKSKTASKLFSSMIVMLLAFCEGSFFPVSQMSDSFNLIGEWTPNGAALTSYIQVAQGADTHRWLPGIYRLIALAGLCLLLSIAIFPKRRDRKSVV